MRSPGVRACTVAAVVAALGLAGCGGDTSLVPADYDGGFRFAGMVLESPDHGPQLCGGATDSNPPQCSGAEVLGWSWESVEHESASGTTWGEYTVVGTWDGESFTLTEEPTRAEQLRLEGNPQSVRTSSGLSQSELQDVQQELVAGGADLPAHVGSGIEDGQVVLTTWLADEATRAALDERFGEGVVRLDGILRPTG